MFIPAVYTLLKKYDRELVKFYPYEGNQTFYIECWMIIKPINFNNHKEIVNLNIKLYSKDLIETLTVDLQNINKLVFSDSSVFYLYEYSCVPVINELFTSQEREASINGQKIKNVYQYANFEFNIVNADEIRVDYSLFSVDMTFEEEFLIPAELGSGDMTFEEELI